MVFIVCFLRVFELLFLFRFKSGNCSFNRCSNGVLICGRLHGWILTYEGAAEGGAEKTKGHKLKDQKDTSLKRYYGSFSISAAPLVSPGER